MRSHFVVGGHTGEYEGRPSLEGLFRKVSQHVTKESSQREAILGEGQKGTGTCTATDYLVLCCGQHVAVQTTEMVEGEGGVGAVDGGGQGTLVPLGAFRMRGPIRSINERMCSFVSPPSHAQ